MNPFRTRVLLPFLLGFGSSSFGQAPSWSPTGSPSNAWYAIACSADGTRVVAAAGGQFANGQIYTSTNSGTNWSPTLAPSLHWTSVACSAEGTRFIASAYGTAVYTSPDAGTTWTSNNIPSANRSWMSVSSSSDGSKLFAVPYGNGLIYHSTNSGGLWLTVTDSFLADAVSVVTTADGSIALAGDNHNHVGVTTNAGSTWVNVTLTILGGSINQVAASAQGERLLAMAFGTALYSSTNRGVTWFTNNLPPASSWLAPACSADGTKLTAAGEKGLLYSSTNSGVSWVSNSAPSTLLWQALASSADGNVVFAAPGNGSIWVRQTSSSPVLKITHSTPGPLVSWTIPSANFILQQGGLLDSPGWTDLTNPPALNLTNLQNQVAIPATSSTALYRLRSQ